MQNNFFRSKIFISIACLIYSFFVFTDKVSGENTNNLDKFKTFEDWCKAKDQLSEDLRHTVEELLLIARTSDCKIAAETLPKGKSLPLVKCQLTCPMTTINRHPYYWSAFSLIGNPW